MDDLKKLGWAFPVGIIVNLYTTFVIQNLWNWFVVPVFHVGSISFWGMFGLVLVVDLLSGGQKSGDKFADDQRWKMLYKVLDYCVPEEKMENVKVMIEEEKEIVWVEIGVSVLSRVVGITVTLVLGWFVHTFLS